MNCILCGYLDTQIISFVTPLHYVDIYCKRKLNDRIRQLKSMLFLSQRLYKKIIALLNVYHKVKQLFETYQNFGYGAPCLYDLLTSGCCLPYASHRRHDTLREEDVLFILNYLPRCCSFTGGVLRCRSLVSPLYMAWVNENVSFRIARLLLHHCDISAKILVNGQPLIWWKDIRGSRRCQVEFDLACIR